VQEANKVLGDLMDFTSINQTLDEIAKVRDEFRKIKCRKHPNETLTCIKDGGAVFCKVCLEEANAKD